MVWRVQWPHVIVRSEPKVFQPGQEWDWKAQTQLLLGEEVRLIEEKGDWAYIEALEHLCFKDGEWRGYPGWIPLRALVKSYEPILGTLAEESPIYDAPTFESNILSQAPQGACLTGKGRDGWIQIETRGWIHQPSFVKSADFQTTPSIVRKWLGLPYLWGGVTSLSAKNESREQGLDCSGLILLAFRLIGKQLPRDAHDQWKQCIPLQESELQPGDLIFFLARGASRMHHVLLYQGNGMALEARGSWGYVVESLCSERLCVPLVETSKSRLPGELQPGDQVYFGRPFIS